MTDLHEAQRRRYVQGFGLSYFVLTTLAAPIVYFAAGAGVPYLRDPVMLAAHGLGVLSLVAFGLARYNDRWAGRLFVVGFFLVVWAAVLSSRDMVYADYLIFYITLAPLLAGFILSPGEVVAAGAMNLFVAAAVGSAALLDGPVVVNAGILNAAVTLVMGITAHLRGRTEATLGRLEARLVGHAEDLESVMATAAEAMVSVDRWGRVLAANRASSLLAGRRIPAGASLEHVLPAEVLKVVEQMRQEARDGPVVAEHGDDPVLQISVQPLVGTRRGHLITAHDVTPLRRAEAERMEQERQAQEIAKLREINAFKSTLLNTASHELNTPLTPIRLQLELLKSTARGPLTEKQQRSVEILDRNTARLAALVEDILDVARMEGRTLPLNRQTVALDSILRDEVQSFEEAAARKGLALSIGELPQAWVDADPRRIGQVLANLVSNAVKFTPHGGHVEVSLEAEEDTWLVRVRDAGIGVPEAQRELLFEPFTQLHAASRDHGGTGLGLYLCQGIVEAHGGTIGHTPEAKGSTFWFRLPRDESAGPGASGPALREAAGQAGSDQDPRQQAEGRSEPPEQAEGRADLPEPVEGRSDPAQQDEGRAAEAGPAPS